jgi:hypothetical protein
MVRRVATATGPDGRSFIAHDDIVEPLTTTALPGYAWHRLWGFDDPPAGPALASIHDGLGHFPPRVVHDWVGNRYGPATVQCGRRRRNRIPTGIPRTETWGTSAVAPGRFSGAGAGSPHAPAIGGVPWVWNVSMVLRPQA